MDRAVPNVSVTLRTGEVPQETAARLILHVASTSAPGLQLEKEGATFVYRMGTAAIPDPGLREEKDPRLERKVSLDLPDTTIRRALAALFEGTGVTCAVMPVVPELPLRLRLKDASIREGLEAVMQQAYAQAPTLYLGQEGPAYVFGFRRTALVQQRAGGLFADGRRGTLNLRDVGLHTALRLMLRDSGFEYEVHPRTPNPRLTVNLSGLALDDAIKAVVAEATKLGADVRVTLKGRTYHFEPGDREP